MSALADIFAPLVDPWTVEQAILSVLSTPPPGGDAARVIYYLAARERQLGLTAHTLKVPPGPSSYQGGVDAFTLEAEWFPMLHVVVTPDGDAVQLDAMTYGQSFQAIVTATAGDNDENAARQTANALAIAAARCLLDHGSLGIGAVDTSLLRSPSPELLDPNARQVIRAPFTLRTFIAPILTVGAPPSWAPDPYDDPAALFTVLETNVTFDSLPPA